MYVQGFVLAVPADNKEAYRKVAADAAVIFKDYGVIELAECWEADVPDGTTTDFRRAVKAESNEKIVFSWMVWPDKATCDAAHERIMKDERFEAMGEPPFDGKRMIYGGFEPVFTMGR